MSTTPTIKDLMTLIDEHKGDIPNGLYLKLCNKMGEMHSKGITDGNDHVYHVSYVMPDYRWDYNDNLLIDNSTTIDKMITLPCKMTWHRNKQGHICTGNGYHQLLEILQNGNGTCYLYLDVNVPPLEDPGIAVRTRIRITNIEYLGILHPPQPQ